MQFVYVISHTKEQYLKFYPGFPSQKESLETVVIFQDSKGSFHLDRPVHPISDPGLTQDVLIGAHPFIQEVFGDIKLFVPKGLGAPVFIKAAAWISVPGSSFFLFHTRTKSLFPDISPPGIHISYEGLPDVLLP